MSPSMAKKSRTRAAATGRGLRRRAFSPSQFPADGNLAELFAELLAYPNVHGCYIGRKTKKGQPAGELSVIVVSIKSSIPRPSRADIGFRPTSHGRGRVRSGIGCGPMCRSRSTVRRGLSRQSLVRATSCFRHRRHAAVRNTWHCAETSHARPGDHDRRTHVHAGWRHSRSLAPTRPC